MPHFSHEYTGRLNDFLHWRLGGTLFYRQEIVEVPGFLTGVFVTYDGIRDDTCEVLPPISWATFKEKMSCLKADWADADEGIYGQFFADPTKVIIGWEGRTIYVIKGGQHPEQWTAEHALREATILFEGRRPIWGPMVYEEVKRLRNTLPVGREHFREYEKQVRIVFTYLFQGELGDGAAQSRTEPEEEGVEIRDILFPNVAESGFWKDLKDKYSASEIVVDAKNTDEVTRDDLRQLYCYLKRALGFWGFLVCRSPATERIVAFNRTLFKNFEQERGVLIVSDDDLRRMFEMALRGQRPSDYLRDRMSDFVRSI
jgi:hypothetical protein